VLLLNISNIPDAHAERAQARVHKLGGKYVGLLVMICPTPTNRIQLLFQYVLVLHSVKTDKLPNRVKLGRAYRPPSVVRMLERPDRYLGRLCAN
jgi:hypothetical protein